MEHTQALAFALRAAKAAPEALTTSQIAVLQATFRAHTDVLDVLGDGLVDFEPK